MGMLFSGKEVIYAQGAIPGNYHDMLDWFLKNYIEILGVITSVLFTILSIKQRPAAWIFGFFSAVLFGIVYYQSKLYASMTLQGYYLSVSVYGWLYWLKGQKKNNGQQLTVNRISSGLVLIIAIIAFAINVLLWWILSRYTDTSYPMVDSFITTISLIATWMLVRKYIENWILWIIVDFMSAFFYLFYIALYPTSFLYIFYTILAVTGFFEWKKELKKIKY